MKYLSILVLSFFLVGCSTTGKLPMPEKKPKVELNIVSNPLKIYPIQFTVVESGYSLTLEQYKLYENNMEKIQNRLYENSITINRLQDIINNF